MKKRIFLTLAAAAVLSGCDAAKDAAATTTPSDEVAAVADAYMAAIVEISPFAILYSGLGAEIEIPNDAFDDISPEANARFEETEDALLARLEKIDPAGLTDRADWVVYETVKEYIVSSVGVRICHQPWQSLNHMFGWQNGLPIIASMQPVETDEERAEAMARWEKLARYIAADKANLEEGLAEGYSVPKRVANRVLAQLDSLLAAPPESSPFIAFAAQGDDDFKAAATALVADKINPAIADYRAFLKDVYIPAARDDLAITANPDGAACYEALLRNYHGAPIGSEKTYQRGQETVAANTAAVIERGKELFGVEDFAEILERTKTAPGNRFESEQDQIDYTRALVPVTKEKSAPFFSNLPAQELVVEPYADYLKGTGQSSRYESTPASEGPATYRINTDEWATQTKGEAQIVVVHEGWPGHHLQIATASSIEGLHPIVQLLSSTAYVEGWARYSEALSEEAGIYDTRYGEISRRAWPARGMVMDPGLHVYGWTERQVKDFAIESGRFDEKSAEALLDRLAVIPGQLTAYDTGGLEIFALRKEAEERLGEKFDIREFHDRILENGAVPLGAMREHVEEWIEENE
ncbi:DUF885 domain-containing protein [Marinicaulis aureus]|uniref:DUF885 domain-containing protein n=1 Tax=Hyphococcus aureus TaxID=2666033 RepID=A0ABW1KV80_9PROT